MAISEVGATSSGGGCACSGGGAAPPGLTETDKEIPAATLMIRVRDQVGEETYFKIKKTTRMEKVFDTYAKRKGLPVASFRFLLDGVRLEMNDMPVTLKLQHLDQIDCLLDQPRQVQASTPMSSGDDEELQKKTVDLEQGQSKLERQTLLVMLTSLLIVPLAMWMAAATRGW